MLRKNKKSWLLAGVVGAVIIIFMPPVFAGGKALPKKGSEAVCNKIRKFSKLHRRMMSYRPNERIYSEIEHQLKNFILPYNSLQEQESDEFLGLDIDGDGKDDKVVRSCGSGTGRLCSLFITLSKNKEVISSEVVGYFYLGRVDDSVYLVSEIYGDISAYTDKDSTQIYHVSQESIKLICEK